MQAAPHGVTERFGTIQWPSTLTNGGRASCGRTRHDRCWCSCRGAAQAVWRETLVFMARDALSVRVCKGNDRPRRIFRDRKRTQKTEIPKRRAPYEKGIVWTCSADCCYRGSIERLRMFSAGHEGRGCAASTGCSGPATATAASTAAPTAGGQVRTEGGTTTSTSATAGSGSGKEEAGLIRVP
jgi:hypothetical protein